MHPRRAPTRVRLRHPTNQRADIGGHRRAPEAAPTLPGPPQPKAPSVPGDDSLRLDDHERRWPSGPKAREHDPEPAVRLRERHPPRSGALEHRQLVPQGKYFKLKRGARMRQRSEGEEEREQYRHDRPAAYPSSAVTSTAATRTDFSVDTRRLDGHVTSPSVSESGRDAAPARAEREEAARARQKLRGIDFDPEALTPRWLTANRGERQPVRSVHARQRVVP